MDSFDRALSKQGCSSNSRHRALQPQEQTIIDQVRIVDAVGIHQDRTDHPAQLNQMVPVATIAGQSRGLDTKYSAYFTSADFGHQALKSGALHQPRTRSPQILVDYVDSLKAELPGPVHQSILTPLAFLVMSHLAGSGLANIDDGLSQKTLRRELRDSSLSPFGSAGRISGYGVYQ